MKAVADVDVKVNRPPRSLGMWAVLTGVVTSEQLQEAYAEWEERGEAPGETFVRRGWMTEQMVADALGELSGLQVVHASGLSDDPDVVGALSAEDAWLLEACPIDRDSNGTLVVALADPSDARLRALKEKLGTVRPVIVVNSELKALLDAAQSSNGVAEKKAPSPTAEAQTDDEPVTEVQAEADVETHDEVVSADVEIADDPADAPEPVDPTPLDVEATDDPAPDNEQLARLHERLVAEHEETTDELGSYRLKVTELAEEQAQIDQEQARIKEEQARIKQEQAQIKQEQARIDEEQAGIQPGITALEARLAEQELMISLIEAKLNGAK